MTYIIHRCACKDQLRDALLYAAALVHKPDHPGTTAGRPPPSPRPELPPLNRQPHDELGQKKHPHQLKGRRSKHIRTAALAPAFRPGSIQPICTGENDDKGDLPQPGRRPRRCRPAGSGRRVPEPCRLPAFPADSAACTSDKATHRHPNDQNQRNTSNIKVPPYLQHAKS